MHLALPRATRAHRARRRERRTRRARPPAKLASRITAKEEEGVYHTHKRIIFYLSFGGGQRTRHPPARRREMTHRAFVPRSGCLQRTGPNGGTHHPLSYRRRDNDSGLRPFSFTRPRPRAQRRRCDDADDRPRGREGKRTDLRPTRPQGHYSPSPTARPPTLKIAPDSDMSL